MEPNVALFHDPNSNYESIFKATCDYMLPLYGAG